MTLPDAEKRLWHSHEYEVKSGVLFLPGVPGPMQRQDLAKVAQTYGKTIHFWQVDRGDNLPLGLPQIMMALTRDGQLYSHLSSGNYIYLLSNFSTSSFLIHIHYVISSFITILLFYIGLTLKNKFN